MGIREDMPVLARHEGVWDGVYTYYNAAGVKVDEHQSRLLCRLSRGAGAWEPNGLAGRSLPSSWLALRGGS